MKSFIIISVMTVATSVYGQDFAKNLADAKSSYESGNLNDARFAMQQMLNDLDVAIGKEVMKLLPSKMEQYSANAANDNVTTNTGLTGVLIHRDYGTDSKMIQVDIMGNSPLVGSLNAILSLPFVGNSSDGTQKQVKVKGYKGIMQKNTDSETNKSEYTIQIPLNSTLLTLVVPDSNEAEAMKMANSIPVAEIAKMIQ